MNKENTTMKKIKRFLTSIAIPAPNRDERRTLLIYTALSERIEDCSHFQPVVFHAFTSNLQKKRQKGREIKQSRP
jgi:hypothetical protein